jgi:hypothetical protein
VADRLHSSFSALQRSSAAAEPLCDDTHNLRERLRAPEADWACLEELARLWEVALQAAPTCADEACVASALRGFARQMAAAGTTSAAEGEALAARLLEAGDKRARRPGPSLAFVVATTQLCDTPLFELDFDGVGAVSYYPDTCVLAVPLMEVKVAPVKGALCLRQTSGGRC